MKRLSREAVGRVGNFLHANVCVEPRSQALADYLDVDVKTITAESGVPLYGHRGRTYAVLTRSEAMTAASAMLPDVLHEVPARLIIKHAHLHRDAAEMLEKFVNPDSSEMRKRKANNVIASMIHDGEAFARDVLQAPMRGRLLACDSQEIREGDFYIYRQE